MNKEIKNIMDYSEREHLIYLLNEALHEECEEQFKELSKLDPEKVPFFENWPSNIVAVLKRAISVEINFLNNLLIKEENNKGELIWKFPFMRASMSSNVWIEYIIKDFNPEDIHLKIKISSNPSYTKILAENFSEKVRKVVIKNDPNFFVRETLLRDFNHN